MIFKLFFYACLLGALVCILSFLPVKQELAPFFEGNNLGIVAGAVILYLTGYCLYRAAKAVNQYLAYRDFQ